MGRGRHFLRPNGNTAGTTTLYALYRRVRVIVPTEDGGAVQVPAIQMPDHLEISCRPQPNNPAVLYFSRPMDLTIPQRRLGMDPAANGGVIDPDPSYGGLYPNLEADRNRYGGSLDLIGADLLLPDVASFEVRVLLANGTDFVDLYDASLTPFNNGNPRFQGAGPRVFDTWTAYRDDTYNYSTWDMRGQDTSVPLYQDAQGNQIRIVAVKITLRVWDVKTQQARQVSLIQDL
jgi:hypothetical protein